MKRTLIWSVVSVLLSAALGVTVGVTMMKGEQEASKAPAPLQDDPFPEYLKSDILKITTVYESRDALTVEVTNTSNTKLSVVEIEPRGSVYMMLKPVMLVELAAETPGSNEHYTANYVPPKTQKFVELEPGKTIRKSIRASHLWDSSMTSGIYSCRLYYAGTTNGHTGSSNPFLIEVSGGKSSILWVGSGPVVDRYSVVKPPK
ncbi:MAG: hypothetical protein JSS72_11770 [Armatimonadetes bacterium]|nr:hypothetical protein [Armatimonadota bacterium]